MSRAVVTPFSKKSEETAPEARKPKAPAPFSLRLSFDERARLKKMAGTRALGEFIRDRLFADSSVAPSPRARGDRTAMARALALLGQSSLSASLGTLARAARRGTLPVTAETEAALTQACADITTMKSELMAALGIRER